jgi:hypothetical protein
MRHHDYMEELRKDVVYAIRTLGRNIGFSLVIVLTLGLGIGANTAIFALIDAVLLRPLDVSHPEQLVAIGNPAGVGSAAQGGPRLDLISYPLYRQLRQRAAMFQGILAAGRVNDIELTVDGHEPEHPRARYVSGNYFAVLGVPAALGRTFGDAEDAAAGASPVAVISHDYWVRRFVSTMSRSRSSAWRARATGARSSARRPTCGCRSRCSRCSRRTVRGSTTGRRVGCN